MAASTCPACGANAFVAQGAPSGSGEASGTCSRCGYSAGESSRCPHCNAVARLEGTGTRSVCAMCGGARIPASFGGDVAANALREQQRALATAKLASIATLLQATLAAAVTLVGLALLPASAVGKALVFALALLPLVLALRSRSRATKARENAKSAGERAWQAAAEDVAAHSTQGVTVPALAKTLGIETDHAEQLLTSLTVHDRTRIDVDDDAEVRYSAKPDTLAQGEEEDELAAAAKALEGEGRVR